MCVPRDSAETFELECGPIVDIGRHSKGGWPSHTFTVAVRAWLRSMMVGIVNGHKTSHQDYIGSVAGPGGVHVVK